MFKYEGGKEAYHPAHVGVDAAEMFPRACAIDFLAPSGNTAESTAGPVERAIEQANRYTVQFTILQRTMQMHIQHADLEMDLRLQ